MEPITPDRYNLTASHDEANIPERKLLTAILDHAIRELTLTPPAKAKLSASPIHRHQQRARVRKWAHTKKQAAAWIFKDNKSMLWICNMLGLDRDVLREAVTYKVGSYNEIIESITKYLASIRFKFSWSDPLEKVTDEDDLDD